MRTNSNAFELSEEHSGQRPRTDRRITFAAWCSIWQQPAAKCVEKAWGHNEGRTRFFGFEG